MSIEHAEQEQEETRPLRPFIVLSGLPASGKTTLGASISSALELPLLDKDAILEELFESHAVRSPQDRTQLSRASDQILQILAHQSRGAVLSSFWRREALSRSSGTPTGWLTSIPDASVVEVLCECPPAIAVQRFQARERHPRHFDSQVGEVELLDRFQRLSAEGPLGLGRTIVVDTSRRVDVSSLCASLVELTTTDRRIEQRANEIFKQSSA